VLAAQAMREVTSEIKARARGLRRLGYGLLFIVGVLLFGGMGVAFYSQILLISHSTAQQEAVSAAEATRDADKKKLDDLAPKFDNSRNEVINTAMIVIPPTPQTSGTTQRLYSVQFAADGQRGWVVGDKGTIRATRDGGETWQAQTSGTTQPLYSVQFAADGQRGWAVGDKGTIRATGDGGETWQAQTSGTTKTLASVRFAADGQRGWAVGGEGTILTTRNGGETWRMQTSGTTKALYSVQFAADGQRGWAVGYGGTILRLDPVDLATMSRLNAAVDFQGVTKALAAAGIKEQVIGQPLVTLQILEDQRTALKKQIEKDEADIQKQQAALPNVFSTKLDPLEVFVFITKFALLLVLFFLVNILVSVYRYSQRLAAQYDAQAYALGLSNALLDPNFHRLVRTLTPAGIDFGKMEGAPTDKILDLVRTALRQRGNI
jgi:photosystem II stability/assembly factor-like uncharacterized protein